ncbi:MAG TPA: hypothetical protein VGL65_03480 [Gemmatimonadales bacterium]
MTQIDVNTFVGTYPYRDIGAWTAEALVRVCIDAGTTSAWVSHLSAAYWSDPAGGNAALFGLAAAHGILRPVAAVHPGRPGWEAVLAEARARRAPAIRCDASWYGLEPAGSEMRSLLEASADHDIPVMMCVRLEDLRQRHPNDVTPDLQPATIRQLIRHAPRARLIVTHADREFIEQVHFGSTPEEASRILWDISCIWGPPEDHLELLLGTVGIERFIYGTGIPLRLAETTAAKIDLLGLDAHARRRLLSENLTGFGVE